MANPREKGKIPHSEWPAIRLRYRSGESLASIARDYRCTAPAIRYIVKRETAGEGGVQAVQAGGPLRAASREIASPVEAAAEAAAPRWTPPRPASRPTGITLEMQKRITTEISFFLVALDAALARGSNDNLLALHDATDRLMRAAARIRIEIERAVDAETVEQHFVGPAQRNS